MTNNNLTNIDFKRKLREDWQNIPSSLIKHLIYFVPRRLQAVNDARVYATKY